MWLWLLYVVIVDPSYFIENYILFYYTTSIIEVLVLHMSEWFDFFTFQEDV